MGLTQAFWFGTLVGLVYGLGLGILLGVIFATNTPSYRGTIAGVTDAVFQVALDEGGEEKVNG